MSFGYDGSIRIDTKINSRNVKTGIKDMVTNMTAGVNKMLASLGKLTAAVGLAFSVNAVINFGRESVKAASDLSSALIGLQSIVEGQGRSFSRAQEFIQDYIKDGLVPMENAVTAYKNLLMRGYSTEQIEQTLVALKDASAFGRQASYSMGEAVATATEGLKNENSILVDNAGVTKNVAKMWEDYAKSIGTTANNLTQQQKIQAEVNGILEESRYQVGDAAKVASTYAGQVSMLSFNLQQLKVAVGNAIIPVIQAAIPAVNTLISSLTSLANVFAQVTTAMFGSKEQAKADEELEDSNENAAESAGDLADATEEVGKATEKTAKKVKGSLAPFDDLKKISASTADSLEDAADDINEGLDLEGAGEGGTLWGNVEVSPEILAFVEELKRKLEELAQVFERVWKPFKDAWDKYGGAVIDAAKRALTSLWGLLKEIGKTFQEIWESSAADEILGGILSIFAGILEFISTLADQFKEVWAETGADFVSAFFYAVSSIIKLIGSIGSAFAEAWNSGVGKEILRTIVSILTNIFNIIGTIATKLREAWEANNNGVEIWKSILNIISAVLGFIDRIAKATLDWAQDIDFEPLISSVRNLLKAFEPLVDIILDGLAWAYTEVLLPFGKWTIEKAAPAILDLFSSAIEVLTTVLDALKPLGIWFWENFLKPIGEFTGKAIIEAINKVTAALDGFSAWVSENQSNIQATVEAIFSWMDGIADMVAEYVAALADIFTVFQGEDAQQIIADVLSIFSSIYMGATEIMAKLGRDILEVMAAPIIANKDKIKEEIQSVLEPLSTVIGAIEQLVRDAVGKVVSMYDEHIHPFLIKVSKSLTEWLGHLLDGWNTYIGPVLDQLATKFSEIADKYIGPTIESLIDAFGKVFDLLSVLWDLVSPIVTQLIDDLMPTLADALSLIGNILLDVLAGITSIAGGVFEALGGLLDFLTGVFTGDWEKAWSGIADIFKGVFNVVVSVLEGAINLIVDGVNFLIAQLNKINVDAPDWITELTGIDGFGFNITPIQRVELPRLADGAVIPPNRQFAAILGDQRSGRNFEAPESLLRQVVREELAGMQSSGTFTIEMPVHLDGREIYRNQKIISRQMGTSFVKVGS